MECGDKEIGSWFFVSDSMMSKVDRLEGGVSFVRTIKATYCMSIKYKVMNKARS